MEQSLTEMKPLHLEFQTCRQIMPTDVFQNIFKIGRSVAKEAFPGGSVDKESTCNAGDAGSIPGSGRSSREGNGNPLQYSCLGNPMVRGTWQATFCGVARLRYDLAKKTTNHHKDIFIS